MNNWDNSLYEDDVDRRLEKDLAKHNKMVKIYTIIGIILLLIIFRDPIMFNLKFSGVFVSKIDKTPINVQEEPVQIDYPAIFQNQNTFVYRSLINGHEIKVIPQAYYKISGLVVAHNHSFLFRNDFFDSAALYDIGIAWGVLADKKLFKKYLQCYSDKNEVTQARVLYVRSKNGKAYQEFRKLIPNNEDWQHQFSHSHLVPANRNVMAALLKIKTWSYVELEGQLIDMEYDYQDGRKGTYRTSTSRTDPWQGNRGCGSCETILVRSVKIGKKVYK